VLKELPLTLILRPFNFDTLATRAFQLAMDEQVAQSAPAALTVIATAAIVVGVMHHAFGRENHVSPLLQIKASPEPVARCIGR
jgi:iron(III) transport system permease protein